MTPDEAVETLTLLAHEIDNIMAEVEAAVAEGTMSPVAFSEAAWRVRRLQDLIPHLRDSPAARGEAHRLAMETLKIATIAQLFE